VDLRQLDQLRILAGLDHAARVVQARTRLLPARRRLDDGGQLGVLARGRRIALTRLQHRRVRERLRQRLEATLHLGHPILPAHVAIG
jgi:hypothetical protein